MSSLFSKFSTLVKSSLGSLRKDSTIDNTYVSSSDIEQQLEALAKSAEVAATSQPISDEKTQQRTEEAAKLAKSNKSQANVLQAAEKALGSAELAPLSISKNASEAVKNSARQANELIEKARELVAEKSAELAQKIESDTPPSNNPEIPTPSDEPLDEIKNRLG